MTFTAAHTILLRRQGLLFVEAGTAALPSNFLEAFEINLAKLGYAVSTRLRQRLQTISTEALTLLQAQVWSVLAENLGGHRTHVPLYRKFPDDVPADTSGLWRRRVLSHFMQAEGQPCLHCGQTGTTHVLNPCMHVVCDQCFDGSNYSACPICERQVDRQSAFFRREPATGMSTENVRLKLLDLGVSAAQAARALFGSFCERTQAMSPVDVADLSAIVTEYGAEVLPWLPATMPVRENIAHVFGTLLRQCGPAVAMPAAAPYMNTATDVLRLVASYSGADPGLLPQTVVREFTLAEARKKKPYRQLFAHSYYDRYTSLKLPVEINRFKMAKLGRPLRRALMAFMESLPAESMTEDMLRHRSYWIWLGEFLHPAEYRLRFPKVALAFEIVRGKAPDGSRAPAWLTYYGKLEAAINLSDAGSMTALLLQRPGELARRFDHALRIAGDDQAAVEALLAGLERCAPQLSTPVLLTLHALLPTRGTRATSRVYWPKGSVVNGVFARDTRAVLAPAAIARSVAIVERELLARFAGKPGVGDFIIDTRLKTIMVPFNERTASPAAIQLPRGSTIGIAPDKTIRLFLHWCEPERAHCNTDLDLSVGFYDAQWQHVGTCSYYQRELQGEFGRIAVSAGDLTSAPYPDGASEFIDLDCLVAEKHGIRYAVAVVNNYSGQAFEELEHAFVGLMLRGDTGGDHFDPRTVEMKFNLQGGDGIFMPMVLDLEKKSLHWLDVYSRGNLEFNNVASSNTAITSICPTMIDYFASGVRANMFDLALLHAAARAQRVLLRGERNIVIERIAGESASQFLQRLRGGEGADVAAFDLRHDQQTMAALLDGDMVLPQATLAYILKPGVMAGTLSASDYLA
ncbi:Stress response protein SCP2 [Duganella sacchari]|uniref:Stress response protein SCP2 n=1 Tax=Duganella sacchari TaxID=551987 RepID=A0A1M7QHC4_9BURK|nr:MXAN_6230/SCO0854 family RING domain-containing protein [Duganella sacchari]SHN30525.1 Stress response protein SCP2 [Duganella sacchari]